MTRSKSSEDRKSAPVLDGERIKGVCKWFNDAKGFGFIVRDDGQKDVFVHHTAIESEGHRTLTEGDAVEFEIIDTEKGPAAAAVRKV